jgi:hypothetical protein
MLKARMAFAMSARLTPDGVGTVGSDADSAMTRLQEDKWHIQRMQILRASVGGLRQGNGQDKLHQQEKADEPQRNAARFTPVF